MTRALVKKAHGEKVPERQGCWQGLASVLQDGLEGYSAPVVRPPFWLTEWKARRNEMAEAGEL